MKLINIDLERPLPDVRGGHTGERWVLVRLHSRPLGILQLDRSREYASADLARLIAERLSPRIAAHVVLEGGAWGSDRGQTGVRPGSDRGQTWVRPGSDPGLTPLPRPTRWPTVTVAVCTRDRAASLGECLDALEQLDYPADRLEIIVVDNAPADSSTYELVSARAPRVRYVREDRPGLDWARNRAIVESHGDLVAFTDDDVRVDAEWVCALATAFDEEPDAMCVTGLVVPDEIDEPAQELFERYGGFGRGVRRIYARAARNRRRGVALEHGGTGRFGTGANMAFRRRVFDLIGLFDCALDVGTVTNGGGDLEIFFRVIKEGHLLMYEPCAVVRHRHRRTYQELRRQLAGHGTGFYSYLVRTALNYPDERHAVLRLGLWWFWYWNVRRLLVSFVRPGRFPRDLILAELRGSLKGLWAYPLARRRAAQLHARWPQERTAPGSPA